MIDPITCNDNVFNKWIRNIVDFEFFRIITAQYLRKGEWQEKYTRIKATAHNSCCVALIFDVNECVGHESRQVNLSMVKEINIINKKFLLSNKSRITFSRFSSTNCWQAASERRLHNTSRREFVHPLCASRILSFYSHFTYPHWSYYIPFNSYVLKSLLYKQRFTFVDTILFNYLT